MDFYLLFTLLISLLVGSYRLVSFGWIWVTVSEGGCPEGGAAPFCIQHFLFQTLNKIKPPEFSYVDFNLLLTNGPDAAVNLTPLTGGH